MAFDLDAFSNENRARCESASGFNHALGAWSLSDWLVAALGELGEAANVAKKLNRVRDGIIGNDETEEQLRAKFASEIADTFIYLDLVAQSQGFRLSDAVRQTFDAKSEKIEYVSVLVTPPTTPQEPEAVTAWRSACRANKDDTKITQVMSYRAIKTIIGHIDAQNTRLTALEAENARVWAALHGDPLIALSDSEPAVQVQQLRERLTTTRAELAQAKEGNPILDLNMRCFIAGVANLLLAEEHDDDGNLIERDDDDNHETMISIVSRARDILAALEPRP